MAQASNVEQKAALLETVTGDEKFSAPLRSFAFALKGRLLIDRGQPGLATIAAKEAIKLDPHNPEALQIRLELGDNLSKADIAQIMLAQISGDLLSEKPAWQFARWLSEIGLAGESLTFYDYASKIAPRRALPVDEYFLLTVSFLNAIIDAGEYNVAIQMLSGMAHLFLSNPELAFLAIEASMAVGQSESVENLEVQLDELFQGLSASGETDNEKALLAAHFYLVIKDDPASALKIMGPDITGKGLDDLFVQRIIGAAELASEDPDEASQGRARLGRIMDHDVYSAALVARYELAKGNTTAAREAINIGLKSTRSGPAFRMLQSVARSASVQIEELPGLEKVRKVLEAYDTQYMAVGIAIDKVLMLTIQPVSEVVSYCEPIEVEVVLTNNGPVPFPIVPPAGGLIQPKVILSVVVKGRMTKEFEGLVKVALPAPRYLEPGQSISAKARIDLGLLGDHINNLPFSDLRLTINGVIGQVEIEADDRITSQMPLLPGRPASILRQGLFSTFGLDPQRDLAGTYQKSLGFIVRDIQNGKLPARLRAARQVGALLRITRMPRRQRFGVPRSVSAVLDELVLVRMLQEVLKDSDPLVRAEMLSSLNGVSVSEVILRELGPAIEDADPLVRFRLAEMLGLSGSTGRQKVLVHLSQDSDEMVRQMAKAVQGIEE